MSIELTKFRIIQTLCRIGLGADNPAFRHQVERLEVALRESGDLKQAKALAQLLAGAEIQNALSPSQLIASSAQGEPLHPGTLPPVDKETGASLAEIYFLTGRGITPPVLPDYLRHAITSIVEEWQHTDELSKVGATPATTCMLFGAPGTGKTRLAHFIAQELRLPLVMARLDGLISSFLGTTARNIANLFQFANRYKCVLLLDEFDAVAKLRDDPQEVGEIKRVVNALLQSIDKRRPLGLTIATTNHEGLLDPAVWRRFDIRISVPIPSQEERLLILESYLPPLELPEGGLKLLTWISEGMTGSDLETMVRTLKRYATVHQAGNLELFDALQMFISTNAKGGRSERLQIPLLSQQRIARTLCRQASPRFTQVEIAQVLGRDQATISRWLKNERRSEKAVVNG